MTHFNGTMKNCNGFSTPTKQLTSRLGVATSVREGLALDKAVRKDRSAVAILRSTGTGRINREAGIQLKQQKIVLRDVFFWYGRQCML